MCVCVSVHIPGELIRKLFLTDSVPAAADKKLLAYEYIYIPKNVTQNKYNYYILQQCKALKKLSNLSEDYILIYTSINLLGIT